MLELIHEYAGLKLDAEVRAGLRFRFSKYFLEKLKTVNKITEHKRQDFFYHLNVSNLHGALKWAIAEKDTELGFELADNLDDLWMSHGYSKEGLELLKQLFALPDPSPPEIRIRRLQNAADLAWQKYDFETSLIFSRESAELAKAHGLMAPYVWYLNRQGRIFMEQGLHNQARQALEECYNLALSEPGVINPGTPLAQLGELALFEGRLDDAKNAFEKAIPYLNLTQFKDDIFLSISKVDSAEVALAEGDFEQAHHWLGLAHEHADVNIRRLLAYLCAMAGFIILAPGGKKKDLASAAQIYGAIESLSERSGIILGAFYQKKKTERIIQALKHLPAREWEKAFQAGQHLSRDEVIGMAKQELEKSQYATSQ